MGLGIAQWLVHLHSIHEDYFPRTTYTGVLCMRDHKLKVILSHTV